MKTGEKLYGFYVEGYEFLPEADGTLWMLRHEKLNTPLAFLERADSNKSFYIAFKTPPADDTGVFHIIEHSVLCGSRKFPVKEPFVELLKSSLKTFLNAMTYPDRTVYPVSSRSDKDFLNLIDVYMDAVFHPLMLENENIFLQEGHRFEIENAEAPITINGVVYNEMKGALSSPDEISSEELLTLLYPDSPFGKNSGGDPDAIRNLTYEDFCKAHQKHYHPSNARIFLDGNVDLSAVLPLLDSYLSEYERREEVIKAGTDNGVISEPKTVKYEISPEEDENGKTRAYLAVRTFDFDNAEASLMLSVLADSIAGSNEAPLVKAFLDEGLCEDVVLFPIGSGIKFGSYAVELKNLSCDIQKAYSFLYSALRKIAKDGIGKDRLEASLNAVEFKLREKDYGSMPKGLVFGLAMLDTWIYDTSPALGLKYEDILTAVRGKLETDAFENMLTELFIKNERCVKLILMPSKTLGKERAAADALYCENVKRSLSQTEISHLIEKNKRFAKWQNAPDSEENLNTLPSLSIQDIPKTGTWTPTDETFINGTKVLVHDIPTGGISYIELLFDISDFEEEELSYVAIAASLLGKCATEKYDADTLAQIKKAKLGAFTASSAVFVKSHNPTPYLYITASALDSNRESLVEIVKEILNNTDFTDSRAIKNILTQKLLAMKEGFISSGHAAAVKRARAYISPTGVLAEYISGYELYKKLKAILEAFAENFEAFSEKLSEICKKSITQSRLTVAVTAAPCEVFHEELTKIPKESGFAPDSKKREALGILNEGFIIPSRVSYISKSASLPVIGESFSGSMHVLSNILSYTYLWNTIRVKGGAYGAGFSARQSGDVSVYSYRDPNPAASVSAANECADFLRAFAEEEDLESYIIGTFGDYDSLNSARSAGVEATTLYMTGKTEETEKATRESMLAFDKAELLRLADITEKLMQSGAVCVFGSSEHIDSCMHLLKTKIEI